jgi:hypothetical protein
MRFRRSIVAIVLAGVLAATVIKAQTPESSTYPDWKGQWVRIGAANFDPTKPSGLKQQAPLTKEYQAILDASVADQAAGDSSPSKRRLALPAPSGSGCRPRALPSIPPITPWLGSRPDTPLNPLARVRLPKISARSRPPMEADPSPGIKHYFSTVTVI